MKTFAPRSSFHHAVVTSSGARRSTSRANASAQRRTTGNVQFGSMRTYTWTPRLPDVCGLRHAELVGMASRGERDANRLDPVGPPFGHALLPDHLAADALRLTLQLARPLVQRADDAVAHRDEVLRQ